MSPSSTEEFEEDASIPLLTPPFACVPVPPKDPGVDNNISKRILLTVGIGIIVLIQIGSCMQKAPLIQIFVDNIRHQYEVIDTDPSLEDKIQKELVFVRSTQSFLETLPSRYMHTSDSSINTS
jgi:hypothetical protein